MAIQIRLVTKPEEREAVYRFRYEVYIEEMQRQQRYADKVNRMIKEPLDDKGHILAAFDDAAKVVGTYRINLSSKSELGYYEDIYQMNWAGQFHPSHTSISTKLMVSQHYRGSTLPVRIAIEAYRWARQHQVEFDFIDCNDHLFSFFIYLGYRDFRGKIFHPEYGEVIPMILVLSDEAHLERVRSPFAKVMKDYKPCVEAVLHTNEQLLGQQLQLA